MCAQLTLLLTRLIQKFVAQVSPTIGACDFCAAHAHSAVSVAVYSSWDLFIQCRPSTSSLEFSLCLVQRGPTTSTNINAIALLVEFLIILRERTLSALLPKYIVLFGCQYILPDLHK